jgi:hypothetical protein
MGAVHAGGAMGITEVVARASYALTVALVIAFSDAATAGSEPPVSASLRADIPPQPLAAALVAFADQTGLELVYVSNILSDRKTPGAHAGLSALDALTSLLKGTGLRFEFLNSRSVRILVDDRVRIAKRSVNVPGMNGGLVEVQRRSRLTRIRTDASECESVEGANQPRQRRTGVSAGQPDLLRCYELMRAKNTGHRVKV